MPTFIAQIGKVASWLIAIIILLIFVDVTFRYLFNATQVWMIELEWHLFGMVILFCGAWTLLEDRHVRVDVFYNHLNKVNQRRLDQIGHVLLGIPWILVVIYVSIKYASYAFAWREGSPDPGGLPARYVLKYCFSIGFILMLIAVLIQLFRRNKDAGV